jgi:hypothetical protein
MCKYLPVGGFEWNTEEWTNDKILSLDDKGENISGSSDV